MIDTYTSNLALIIAWNN